ncbi:MAG TPA: cytochrome P450 [Candidatus Avamphibacillus sp.]|nr:cytochrome P450 [Candidatus Avamphibacillus sp.]
MKEGLNMPYREQIPIDHGIDNTIKLLLEGYEYISNRRERFQSNMFETRVLGGQKAVCLSGEEAAKVFYDNEKFKRQGAAPKRVLKTLFGEDGVQTLDAATHVNHKKLFMSLMNPEKLAEMTEIIKKEWERAIDRWTEMDEVVLYDEANKLLTKSVCEWAGVPLWANELDERTKELNALFEAGGAVGPRHWQGRIAREKVEKWAAKHIENVRDGKLNPEEDTALYKMAWHQEENGKLMETGIASVELVNILRPTVAVSVYIAFCALALHDFPEEKEKLETSVNEMYYQMFVQEVRRYYPFFPMAVARVRKDFLWKGHDFKEGTLVMLDLYGTNHHPDLWENPNEFNPERFKNWDGSLFNFIPQGGGDYYMGHRCPGEGLTIEIMKASLEMMVHHMDYDVPAQDLDYSMTRMPSLPRSKFIMKNVRRK